MEQLYKASTMSTEWTVGAHGKEWWVHGDSVLQLLTTAWKKEEEESNGREKTRRKEKGKIRKGWG